MLSATDREPGNRARSKLMAPPFLAPPPREALPARPKESIDESSSKHDTDLLDELLMHIASLASVYHKPPSSFLPDYLGTRPPLDCVCVLISIHIVSTGVFCLLFCCTGVPLAHRTTTSMVCEGEGFPFFIFF